jgi:flavorubredoxin
MPAARAPALTCRGERVCGRALAAMKEASMSTVLVVYCSMTGNTRAAAEAVAEGARAAGAKVVLKEGLKAAPEDLLACQGVALGSYDAFSYVGGGLKDFFDRSLYPARGKADGKPYVGFLSHGGGGKAVGSLESLAGSLKLKKVADTVSVVGRPDEAAVAALKALGAVLAAAAK